MTLVGLRKLSQGIALGVFVGGALAFALGASRLILSAPQVSPLVLLTTRVAGRGWVASFVPAVLFVLLGLLVPRLFCGWVCPLGTLIDLSGRSWARPVPQAPIRGASRTPLLVLLLLVGAAFLSVDLAGWLDPVSLLTRTVAPEVVSERDGVYQALGGGGGSFWTSSGLNHQMASLAIIVVAIALGLTVRGRRAWCRLVCPLGALYGVVGQWALFRRRRADECSGCGACARRCGMGAVGSDGSLADPASCVGCQACAAGCLRRAVRFRQRRRRRHGLNPCAAATGPAPPARAGPACPARARPSGAGSRTGT